MNAGHFAAYLSAATSKSERGELAAAWFRDIVPEDLHGELLGEEAPLRVNLSLPSDLAPDTRKTLELLAKRTQSDPELADHLATFAKWMGLKDDLHDYTEKKLVEEELEKLNAKA